MSKLILPAAKKASSKILSEVTKVTSSKFQVAYFNFHGRAESTRYLLAHAGVPWKETVFDRPTDPEWQRQKPKTPYKCLPVVYEATSSGAVLEISEVLPIERYLADKFGLAGSDPWERFQVEQAVSSIESSQLMYHSKVVLLNWPSPGAADSSENQIKRQWRAEDANRFYETGLKNFADIYEEKLHENGGRMEWTLCW
ncbi:hypothetical protein BGZ47_006130 [Haplosporangium gracile]|nr:hypothetical protein BGZ47_006130 [Haplosporangium gracile]